MLPMGHQELKAEQLTVYVAVDRTIFAVPSNTLKSRASGGPFAG
jgi:hypothetical protein